MKLYSSKEELITALGEVYASGWHRSVKSTLDSRNDGAVGNTLEALLGLTENNLPLPNALDWELKGQRSATGSLITLKHIEPSPRGARIVANFLLPYYGWKHRLAGTRYPSTEMSFRSTTSATAHTSRGFIIVVDRPKRKLRFVFDSAEADTGDPEIASWLRSVVARVGLGPLDPEPYWGFDDLRYQIGTKIKNCFYAVADCRVASGAEWFRYRQLYMLSGFSFDKFLECVEDGAILVDFDARTGHNHGTKFRFRQGRWRDLYSDVQHVI